MLAGPVEFVFLRRRVQSKEAPSPHHRNHLTRTRSLLVAIDCLWVAGLGWKKRPRMKKKSRASTCNLTTIAQDNPTPVAAAAAASRKYVHKSFPLPHPPKKQRLTIAKKFMCVHVCHPSQGLAGGQGQTHRASAFLRPWYCFNSS